MNIAMEPISASSHDDLIASLARIDITVPLRTEGRTTEHCEQWSICRLLASISASGTFGFPLRVVHRDRPDFHIRHALGDIGIEVTEVISENDAAIDAFREHNEVEGPFFLKRHRPGEPRLRGKALRNEATSIESGDGWVGNSVEREWIAAMREFIARKVEKSASPGFQLFSENWLLMYDNYSLPALDRKVASEMLFEFMGVQDFGPFQRIWIESSKQIWCFTPVELHSKAINDLWGGS